MNSTTTFASIVCSLVPLDGKRSGRRSAWSCSVRSPGPPIVVLRSSLREWRSSCWARSLLLGSPSGTSYRPRTQGGKRREQRSCCAWSKRRSTGRAWRDAAVFGRLYAKRLVALGLPRQPDPIVWYTMLGLAMLLAGALVLRLVETQIDGAGMARRSYVRACVVGAVGMLVLAHAPDGPTAAAGVLLVGGLSLTVLRLVGTIWVNRRTASDVRATVHSFLAQAEYLGEIVVGLSLALLARATTVTVALTGAAFVMVAAAVLVRSRSTTMGVIRRVLFHSVADSATE